MRFIGKHCGQSRFFPRGLQILKGGLGGGSSAGFRRCFLLVHVMLPMEVCVLVQLLVPDVVPVLVPLLVLEVLMNVPTVVSVVVPVVMVQGGGGGGGGGTSRGIRDGAHVFQCDCAIKTRHG